MSKAEKNLKFCYTKTLPMFMGKSIARAISAKGKTWDVGQTLNIYFIGGTKAQKSKVYNTVQTIKKYANINFRLVSHRENSDIRVSFMRGRGSWSYVGTDAIYVPDNEPTMNFGWGPDTATILHEFLHALGFKHEHQNPRGGIDWNRENVIRDLSGPPNNWDVRTIERNVLNMESLKNSLATSFDIKSIMIYAFPDSWTKNTGRIKQNKKLSSKDKQHLSRLYPFTKGGTLYSRRSLFKRVLDWFR